MAGCGGRPSHVRRDSGGGRVAARRATAARATVAAECALSASILYLLVLLAAGARAKWRSPCQDGSEDSLRRFVILIPAHDEEAEIEGALESLHRLSYPRAHATAVVVADNCGDSTAEVAARNGATVYERNDPAHRGKGHALAWGFARVLQERPAHDAVVVLDADCRASPNLLSAIDARFAGGASAVQVRNVVANPNASSSSALRAAASSLMNTARPLGKDALGLSCGLFGTGMAFRRDLLERHPWESHSLAEDAEQHLRLVAMGERVVFAPEAFVASPATVGRRDQELRWEGGKSQLLRGWALRLVLDGLRRRDVARLHAGLEHFIPPQSLLAGANLVLGTLALSSRSVAARRLAAANLLGHATFVLGGLAVARAPRAAYAALVQAPAVIVRKAAVYARIAARGEPRAWVRGERAVAPASSGGAGDGVRAG